MKWGGLLIDPNRYQSTSTIVWYAACEGCDSVYQDNMIGFPAVCPKCKQAPIRGFSKEKAKAMLDKDQKELLA